jgi:hypothetical protein
LHNKQVTAGNIPQKNGNIIKMLDVNFLMSPLSTPMDTNFSAILVAKQPSE